MNGSPFRKRTAGGAKPLLHPLPVTSGEKYVPFSPPEKWATSINPSFPRRRESKFSWGRDFSTKLDSRLRGNDGNFRLIEVPNG